MKKEEVIKKVLSYDFVEELKRQLQESLLYDEHEKVSLEYDENVNPEVDFDEVKVILEEVCEKVLSIKEQEILEKIDVKIDWIRFTRDSKSFLKLTKEQQEALTEATIKLLESLKDDLDAQDMEEEQNGV